MITVITYNIEIPEPSSRVVGDYKKVDQITTCAPYSHYQLPPAAVYMLMSTKINGAPVK